MEDRYVNTNPKPTSELINNAFYLIQSFFGTKFIITPILNEFIIRYFGVSSQASSKSLESQYPLESEAGMLGCLYLVVGGFLSSGWRLRCQSVVYTRS